MGNYKKSKSIPCTNGNEEYFTETTINDFSFTGDLNWTSEAVENIIKNCIEHTADNGKLKMWEKQV